jgi:hypothetical protein
MWKWNLLCIYAVGCVGERVDAVQEMFPEWRQPPYNFVEQFEENYAEDRKKYEIE